MRELTPREREIMLTMVRKGMDDTTAATHFGLARRTIQTHLHNIYPKLGIHNRWELDRYALIHGLVKVEELEESYAPGHRSFVRAEPARSDTHGNNGSVSAPAPAA